MRGNRLHTGSLAGKVLAQEAMTQRREADQRDIDEKTKLLEQQGKTIQEISSWVDGYKAGKEKAEHESSCCRIL